MREINNDIVKVEVISSDFVICSYFPGLEIKSGDILESLNNLKEHVAENGKIKLIIEIPPTTIITTEAMNFLGKEKYKNANTVALALVTESIAQRVISKFYHTNVEVGVPTKFFKSKEKAIAWISQF